MRRLIDDGWTASAAAAAIIAGTEPPARATADLEPGVQAELLVGQLVDAATALDSPRIESILDEMFAAGTYERVVDDHVIPAAPCARRGVGGRHAVCRRRACREQRGPASSRGLVPGVRSGTRPGPTRARRDAARRAPRAWRAHVRDGAASGRPSRGLPRGGCAIGRLDRGRRTDGRTGRRDRRRHACRCDRCDRGLVDSFARPGRRSSSRSVASPHPIQGPRWQLPPGRSGCLRMSGRRSPPWRPR